MGPISKQNMSQLCVCNANYSCDHFREKPRQTAARESEEETLGVVGDEKSLQQMLRNYQENNAFKVLCGGGVSV